MDGIELSESQIFQALEEALAPKGDEAPGALTVSELSRALNKPRQVVRDWLREMIDQDMIETVKVHRICINGTEGKVPAYRWKQAASTRGRKQKEE